MACVIPLARRRDLRAGGDGEITADCHGDAVDLDVFVLRLRHRSAVDRAVARNGERGKCAAFVRRLELDRAGEGGGLLP